jgi:hypothetical protein
MFGYEVAPLFEHINSFIIMDFSWHLYQVTPAHPSNFGYSTNCGSHLMPFNVNCYIQFCDLPSTLIKMVLIIIAVIESYPHIVHYTRPLVTIPFICFHLLSAFYLLFVLAVLLSLLISYLPFF